MTERDTYKRSSFSATLNGRTLVATDGKLARLITRLFGLLVIGLVVVFAAGVLSLLGLFIVLVGGVLGLVALAAYISYRRTGHWPSWSGFEYHSSSVEFKTSKDE